MAIDETSPKVHFLRLMVSSHKYSLGFIVILLICLLAYCYSAILLPSIIEKKFISILVSEISTDGTVQYDIKEKRAGLLTFNNIQLDKDRFNTIEEIRLVYSPFSVFRMNGKLFIKNADISYSKDIKDVLPLLLDQTIKPIPDWLKNFETIEISLGHVNLLTHDMGSLLFRVDGIIRTTGDEHQKSFQLNIKSAQKLFALDADVSGEVDKNKTWHANIALNKGRYEGELIQSSRITGYVSIDSANNTTYIKSELNLGILQYYDYGFSEVALSAEWQPEKTQIVMSARGQKFDAIEFGINYSSDNPDNLYGSIYTPSLRDLVLFYNRKEPISKNQNSNSRSALTDLYFSYEMPISDLNTPVKNVLARFERLELENIVSALNIPEIKGSATLQGAMRVQAAPNAFILGGLTVRASNGHIEMPMLHQRQMKRNFKPQQVVNNLFDNKGTFSFEKMTMTITGEDTKTKNRLITLNVDNNAPITKNDDLDWFWNSIINGQQN